MKAAFCRIWACFVTVLGMFFHSFAVCFLAPPRAESGKANTSNLMTLLMNFDVFARSTCCRNLQNVCQNRRRSASGAEVSLSWQTTPNLGSILGGFWLPNHTRGVPGSQIHHCGCQGPHCGCLTAHPKARAPPSHPPPPHFNISPKSDPQGCRYL